MVLELRLTALIPGLALCGIEGATSGIRSKRDARVVHRAQAAENRPLVNRMATIRRATIRRAAKIPVLSNARKMLKIGHL